jgi:NAD(P)-dependent dehydrogenase (short-subunit alcohol dehydrogenase family)
VRADILEASEESFDRLARHQPQGPVLPHPARRAADDRAARRRRGGGAEDRHRLVDQRLHGEHQPGDYCVAKAGLAMTATLYAARLAEYGINVYEIRPASSTPT